MSDVIVIVLPYMGKPKEPTPSNRAAVKRRRFIVMTDLEDYQVDMVNESLAPMGPDKLLELKEHFEGRPTAR